MPRQSAGVKQYRFRSELEWQHRIVHGASRWLLHDPIRSKFFYFSSQEYHWATQLDGSLPMKDWLAMVSVDAGADQNFGMNFLQQLESQSLLLHDGFGQGKARMHRRNARDSKIRRSLPFRLLTIRVPLFDPTPWTARMRPLADLWFSKAMFALTGALTFVFLMLLVRQFNFVQSEFANWTSLLTLRNVFLTLAAYAALKSFHEISHILACVHHGVQCREIGLLFIAFTPCVYCDVSDAWRLANRTHRASIAAAGVYAEMLIAVTAGILWLSTYPGILHSCLFLLALLGSVSTLLVNANPLLRYDGYHVLVDLWDVPNLMEQANEALWAPLKNFLYQIPQPSRPLDSSPWLLGCFGCCAFLYRWWLTAMILLAVHLLGQYWHLTLLSSFVIALTISGIAMQWFANGKFFWIHAIRNHQLRMARLTGIALLLCTLVSIVVFTPFAHRLEIPGVVQGGDSIPLYVAEPGFLSSFIREGDDIRQGETIVILRSPALALEWESIQGRLSSLRQELESTKKAASSDPNAASGILLLETKIATEVAQLKSVGDRRQLLDITSPIDGRFVSGQDSPSPQEHPLELANWVNVPLDPMNQNAYLDRGVLLGWIVNDHELSIEGYASEYELYLLQQGQPALVRLDQHPNNTFEGHLVKLSHEPADVLPKTITGDSRLPWSWREEKPSQERENLYRLSITVRSDHPITFTQFGLATVQLQGPSQSLWNRALRFLQRSFRPLSLFSG